MTNVEQSSQVLSVEQAGAFYPASKLTRFFFFFARGVRGREGGEKNGKESLKSLLKISQVRVSDIKNEFQCLYFNLYFSCLITRILNSSVIFTKLSEAFFCWLALNNRTTLEKKKRIVKYNIYSLP